MYQKTIKQIFLKHTIGNVHIVVFQLISSLLVCLKLTILFRNLQHNLIIQRLKPDILRTWYYLANFVIEEKVI